MIVVTGATGHVGNVLVRELSSLGRSVRALVLPGEDITPLKDSRVEIIEGDVRDKPSLVRAFNGANMVYHLAGIISIISGQKKIMNDVNINGTKNVIEACRENGVDRLIYTSSIHALSEPPHGTVITENQPFDPFHVLGDYAKSKAAASIEVGKAIKDGFNAVIVCPTGIIGPYDYRVSEMGTLIKNYLNKKVPACVNGAYDFVDVRDIAGGMIAAAENGRSGETYILSGEQITIPALFTLLEKASGIKAPKLNISAGLARFCGLAAAPFQKFKKNKPLFTTYSIDVLTSNSLVSSAKAKKELGYTARPIKDSIIDSIKWFKEEGLKNCGKIQLNSSMNPI